MMVFKAITSNVNPFKRLVHLAMLLISIILILVPAVTCRSLLRTLVAHNDQLIKDHMLKEMIYTCGSEEKPVVSADNWFDHMGDPRKLEKT